MMSKYVLSISITYYISLHTFSLSYFVKIIPSDYLQRNLVQNSFFKNIWRLSYKYINHLHKTTNDRYSILIQHTYYGCIQMLHIYIIVEESYITFFQLKRDKCIFKIMNFSQSECPTTFYNCAFQLTIIITILTLMTNIIFEESSIIFS